MGVESADGQRRILDELAAACDPDLARPLIGDSPVQQLREQIGTDHQLLNESLSYMDQRGRLGGAQMAYHHAGRVITGEATADPAPAVDLAAERARRRTD